MSTSIYLLMRTGTSGLTSLVARSLHPSVIVLNWVKVRPQLHNTEPTRGAAGLRGSAMPTLRT